MFPPLHIITAATYLLPPFMTACGSTLVIVQLYCNIFKTCHFKDFMRGTPTVKTAYFLPYDILIRFLRNSTLLWFN